MGPQKSNEEITYRSSTSNKAWNWRHTSITIEHEVINRLASIYFLPFLLHFTIDCNSFILEGRFQIVCVWTATLCLLIFVNSHELSILTDSLSYLLLLVHFSMNRVYLFVRFQSIRFSLHCTLYHRTNKNSIFFFLIEN